MIDADGFDLSLLKNPPSRIVKVEVCAPLTVQVRYNDGVTGIVRFEASKLKGVFEPLNDPEFFARVGVYHGALAWPDELEFCADAIYMQVVRSGEWVLR